MPSPKNGKYKIRYKFKTQYYACSCNEIGPIKKMAVIDTARRELCINYFKKNYGQFIW